LSDPDDTILDPFAGTGTTGMAALFESREAHLVELDETGNYQPVLKGRLEDTKQRVIDETPVWEECVEIDLDWEDASDTKPDADPSDADGMGDFFSQLD
jgi:hypothetical protein